MADTTALGIYDHGYVTAVQRRPTPSTEGRLWHIRAKRIVIATGATERPIVFANDDRPGIMLAGAAAAYVERYGVRPGDRAVIFTTNGTTDAVAAAWRPPASRSWRRWMRAPVMPWSARSAMTPAGCVGVVIAREGEPPATVDGRPAAGVGGWNPNVALWTQARGTLRFDERIAAFVPDRPGPAADRGRRRRRRRHRRPRRDATDVGRATDRPGDPGRVARHYVDSGATRRCATSNGRSAPG